MARIKQSKELTVTTNEETSNVIDTREIAEIMGMKHYQVLEKLEGTKDGKTKGIIPVLRDHEIMVSEYFIESSYKTEDNNKTYKRYLCTKMGCEFLANKFTGEKGILFTAKYVKRFNEMEQKIKETVHILTQEELGQLIARTDGVIRRNRETSAISQMISKGELKGVKGSPYAVITNTTYNLLYGMYCGEIKKYLSLDENVNLRDYLSTKNLEEIREIEDEIHWMHKKGYTWKEIYNDLMKEYIEVKEPKLADKSILKLKKMKNINYIEEVQSNKNKQKKIK